MMDKRTARKVHGLDFRTVITQLRRQWTHHHTKNQDVDGTPESSNPSGIQVYIRKRPMLPHEPKKKEYDVVTCAGSDTIIVHDCQMYAGPSLPVAPNNPSCSPLADMKRKFIENHVHKFSKCFGETASTDDVFDEVGKPLVDHAIAGGKSVIMMYANHPVSDAYRFGRIADLLRRRQKVLVCDDEAGNSRLLNVTEREATSAPALLAIIHEALDMRATEATSVNAVSSRSHFLCSISIRDTAKPGASRSKPSATTPCRPPGVLTLLDLAGSERNEDSFHHSADRRRETIEINSSHLALKQCVRALGAEDPTAVVPYRHSILTRLLKESLWANGSRAAVIATVSPIATDDVVKWWSGLKKGLYAKYTGNIKAIDGKQLLRLALPRLIQLCNNNSIDGEAVFKSLQKEKAADDKSDKERRARNIAVRKNK
ncbi:hypothetical protein DYB32_007872 [Aphanomyces invadans]|uniref:Kinesin motor domain-containing protein n=1 Tax=Aphanomyces invadans TaxID=157072 RepID=A0A3R7CW88_9STRA|nr:hypothetical protein DYB32_007872 [Aphanomyces invadans]